MYKYANFIKIRYLMQTIIMNKSRKFGTEILSHFREITLFCRGHFLSVPCTSKFTDKNANTYT